MAPSVPAIRRAALFALVAGSLILVWWLAVFVLPLPEALSLDAVTTAHVVAEVLLGIGLLASGGFVLRVGMRARVPLVAALGATVYASVNAIGLYADNPFMVAVLVAAALAAASAFVAVARLR